jgi:hypothetical protein
MERPGTRSTISLARWHIERVARRMMVLYPLLAVVVFAVILTGFFVLIVVLARDAGVL